jgi:hypothetical protein
MRWSGFRFSRHPFSVSFKANGGPKPPGRYAGRETGRSHRLHAHLVVDWCYDAAVKGADAVTARPGFRGETAKIWFFASQVVYCCVLIQSCLDFLLSNGATVVGHRQVAPEGCRIMMVEAMIAKPSAPAPRRTWRPVTIRLRSSAEAFGAVAVVVVAAMIVVATVIIVLVLAELLILIARGTFAAARWHYRRRTVP